MNKFIIICLALFLCGCENPYEKEDKMKPISTDEVIRELKLCRDNHFYHKQSFNSIGQTVSVTCYEG